MIKPSKRLAGIIGPAAIAISLSEFIHRDIWATSSAPVIYLNGTLLFVAGLSIIRIHNYWKKEWSLVITLSGWFMILLGLFRMFAPKVQLEGAQNIPIIAAMTLIVLITGIFLSVRSFNEK